MARGVEAESSVPRLWYRESALDWSEALPIGNGRLGAMIFGGVAEERIQLNENTFYSDEPGRRDLPLDVKGGYCVEARMALLGPVWGSRGQAEDEARRIVSLWRGLANLGQSSCMQARAHKPVASNRLDLVLALRTSRQGDVTATSRDPCPEIL